MKIGPRSYNEQETIAIQAVKQVISDFQGKIEDNWQWLLETLKINGEDFSPETDYLWDYVMNDFGAKDID